MFKQSNTLTSPQNYLTVVFIDDLNLPTEEISPLSGLRSLVEYQGWYSQENKKFLYIEEMTLVCGYS